MASTETPAEKRARKAALEARQYIAEQQAEILTELPLLSLQVIAAGLEALADNLRAAGQYTEEGTEGDLERLERFHEAIRLSNVIGTACGRQRGRERSAELAARVIAEHQA
jgi:hypothetical protein